MFDFLFNDMDLILPSRPSYCRQSIAQHHRLAVFNFVARRLLIPVKKRNTLSRGDHKKRGRQRKYMKQYRIICHLNAHNQIISFQIFVKLYSKDITQLISHAKITLCISSFLLQIRVDKVLAKAPFDKTPLEIRRQRTKRHVIVRN